MIYGGEQLIQYPVKDLYDKAIMLMSIAAAKDMYEKGLQQIKDFNEKYGDFTSPILKDMDWYNLNVTGKVRDTINNLYANGIDPLRSAEGRAAISLLIYSMPVGDIAKLRLSAETVKEYLKSFDDNTNPELEKFLGRDLSTWSTLGGENNPANGVWMANKASKYQTIDDLIEPIVKNVDYTYDEAMTKSHNDGNNYYSITRDRLMQAVNDNMADILATPSGAFHWEQAKRAAAAQGGGEKLAKSIFNDMIGNRLSDHERIKFEPDQFRLDDYRTRNDIRAHAANAATDYAYKIKEATDPRLNGNNKTEVGYNVPEDVYITSLAKGAGIEYLPKGGITPGEQQKLLDEAIKRQTNAINASHNVLKSTGMFISPEKIAGLIQSTDKKGDMYFLDPNYFKNLHETADISTSFKNWTRRGKTKEQSRAIRKLNAQLSKDITSGMEDWYKERKDTNFRIGVVPVSDENGNNVYAMVGEDNRWHTYAVMRVYASDGKETKAVGKSRLVGGSQKHDIPKEGRLMVLEVGLSSNEGTGVPDLSVSARENLGGYGYFATDDWVGRPLNSGFGFADRITKH